MKRVYLIRHTLPDFPGGRRMCIGTTDLPLGAEGLAQAGAMAGALPPVTAVFSSPLLRALQTARAIGMPITILEDLRELHAGAWDGLTFDEIRSCYPDLYKARGQNRSLPLPGGEDHAEGLARFTRAMDYAARTAPGDFALIAHGGIIAAFLQSITGTFYKPDYGEIIPLSWENGIYTLKEETP